MALKRKRESIPVSIDAYEYEQQKIEDERVIVAEKARLYYEGEQYEKKNEEMAVVLQCTSVDDLPEHKKLIAYSTQIAECINFLAARLGEGFTLKAKNSAVQDVIEDIIKSTEEIAAESETGDVEVVTDTLLTEAMQTGDVAVMVKWDPIEKRVFWEFWESEAVEFRQASIRKTEMVIRTQMIWILNDIGDMREVSERVEYTMEVNAAGQFECRAATFHDHDEDPVDIEWLGVGSIPWRLLRVQKKGLRTFRGNALISKQVMRAADRYNAVEQVSWLIARYNSHANLVVTGDGAEIETRESGRIQKDVADVLTFPGGTSATVIELPTDPQMIEHQRAVLAEAMYNVFGLTRVAPDTLEGLGQVSGYALEILNQKSDATFKQVGRQWRKDWTTLLGLSLDVHAWKSQATVVAVDRQTGAVREVSFDDEAPFPTLGEFEEIMQAFWLIEPNDVFPERKVEIRMGSGYIVDSVMVRDDFVADLISREEALRKRGYEPGDITKIVNEIEAATAAGTAPNENGSFGTTDGAAPSGEQQAGGTVAGTTARS